MGEPYLDTNIILRFLTGDDPNQQERAKYLFERIERNELQVNVPVTVIADTIYVLSSKFYNLPRPEIVAMLKPLVRLPGFRIHPRRVVLHALDLYGNHSIDFGDALIIAAMQQSHSQTLFSFDRDFDQFDEITRAEP